MKLILQILCCSIFILNVAYTQNFALQFDGEEDEVRIGNNSIFEIQNQFTIEAWINASEWRQESWQGSIVCKDGPDPVSGFAFRCGKNGTLSFVMSVNNTWRELATGPIMDVGVWNHVAIVVDNGTMALFVNGEEEATLEYNGQPSGSAFVNLKIGASGGFEGRVFNGAIDEVRIWNTARTMEELNAFKNESLAGNETGLISYFNFNEGTGDILGNKTNTNLSGTLLNMTEEDWVGGTSISSTDAGVTNITNPDMVSVFQRPVRVGVEVKNFGSEPLTNIPISLTVNEELLASEIITAIIPIDGKMTYFFETILDLRDNENIALKASVNLSDDGNTLNNTKSLSLSKQANPSIINIFDKKQHNFGSAGQTHLKSLILPQDLQVYEQILLHIDLDCPAEGCDPWDQPANISIIKDGQEFEIARYITPYRKACGPWTVDITDFKSLLGGATTFKSYIQVFGPSGWLLNLDIELIPSAAGFTYNKLSPLWNNQYIVYGDPGISYNLPVIQNPIEENTLSSHLRITLSGHGQGNTNNAAEFSNRTHEIIGNNFTIANHNLWKNDCEFNTCADQFGTWEFDRAGWCPGQAVDPFILNTTSNFNAGGQAFLDYKFEPYTNLLNSGYNGAGHTEPHYRMASYLIQSSNERFEDYTNLNITSIKVATDSSNANVEFGPVTVEVKNEGNAAVENPILAYYLNNTLVVEETLNQSIAPGETVTYNFINVGDFVEGQDYLVIGSVELANDENLDDNLIATFLNGNTTSRNEFIHKDAIQVYPNPSTGSFTVLSQDINMEEIVIFDLNGQIIYNNIIQQETFDFEIPTSGIYILTIKGDNQKIFRQKLVVIE